MTFDIFLKSNALQDAFQSETAETVSFENRNGKKFTYLISDVERCLRVIWESRERLVGLLENDWSYAEEKYRAALGELFKNEEWNSVVSNLGSQTPNTVRCLELYACFKLNRQPTLQLSTPDILYWKRLEPIFLDLDVRSRFEQWLKIERRLKSKSITHYSTAVSGVLSRAAGVPLFEVASEQDVIALKNKILNSEYIRSINKNGNGMYLSAFNNYVEFLRQNMALEGANSALSFSEISRAFETDLMGCGFISF